MRAHFTPLRKLLIAALLAWALAGCGGQPEQASAPTPSAEHLAAARLAVELGDNAGGVAALAPLASSGDEERRLLAHARLGLALERLADAPGEPLALRSALDLITLALPLTPTDDPLHGELAATQAALAQLLALEDAGRALEALAQSGAAPEALATAARALGEQALRALEVEPRLPGAAATAGAGLLRAATALEAESAGEALSLCERAAALAPADEAARACTERLTGLATAPAAAPAPPTTAPGNASAAPRPPAPTRPARPAAIVYGVTQRKSFDGSGNSGAFASCIDVQILRQGNPVGGAVIGFNNGEHSYQSQTNADGYAGRCGLGASTWSVVLFWTPADGTVRGVTTTVYLSGAAEQRGAVVFEGR